MVAAPPASLSTSASAPSAGSSTTAGALQQSQPAAPSSSSSSSQQPPAVGGKALVQVDAATVASARNPQRNSYITPHTLHSYQAATAAAAVSSVGLEQIDAPGGAAVVQPSVAVACRESCRRYVALPFLH